VFSNPAATRDKRPTGSAIHSKVKRRRRQDPPCKSLATRPGPTEHANSPTPAWCQEHVCPKCSTCLPPPKTVGLASQPTLSEISEHHLEEPWDETWHPTALDSSKSVCIPRQFDSLSGLSPCSIFTGPVTVSPGHSPPPADQARKTLPPLWSHEARMLSHNQGHTDISRVSLCVGFPNTRRTNYDTLSRSPFRGIRHMAGSGPPKKYNASCWSDQLQPAPPSRSTECVKRLRPPAIQFNLRRPGTLDRRRIHQL
jgi:hypothetical protein